MQDQSTGFGLIIFALFLLAFLLMIFRPIAGMAIMSLIFFLIGLAWFFVAKGGIHETTGAVFIVGSAVCAGISGLCRTLEMATEIILKNLSKESTGLTDKIEPKF